MKYVFDTNSFRVMRNYFHDRFPSFWTKVDHYMEIGKIISVKEVYEEIRLQIDERYKDWITLRKDIFKKPSEKETEFIPSIFAVRNFANLIGIKQIKEGKHVADPFLIASAKINNACVVTEEKYKPNAPTIPNVCEYFSIQYTSLEGFMIRENWKF